jgi:hypothetical protein
MWILNAVLCYTLWKVADMYYEANHKMTAWLCVAVSAANGAIVLTHFI